MGLDLLLQPERQEDHHVVDVDHEAPEIAASGAEQAQGALCANRSSARVFQRREDDRLFGGDAASQIREVHGSRW